MCYRGFQKCAKFGCSGRSFNTKVYSLNYESSRQIGPIMSEVFFGKNYCGAHIAHIAHLRNFCILCIRPKSCFGGVNEQSGYLVFEAVRKVRARKVSEMIIYGQSYTRQAQERKESGVLSPSPPSPSPAACSSSGSVGRQ